MWRKPQSTGALRPLRRGQKFVGGIHYNPCGGPLVALSSGCFIHKERLLLDAPLESVELSSHRAERLDYILSLLRQKSVAISSIHSPCPSRGIGLNLGGAGESWWRTKAAIKEVMQLAASVSAKYIVIHAFYCIDDDLPADDLERAAALRRIFGGGQSIKDYVSSESYNNTKENTKRNLKSILPNLKRSYPNQRIVLENLNPRIGYGGIVLDDVYDVVSEFNGDVGICLDVGHLTLAMAALDRTVGESLRKARDLIWTIHIHQNFAGKYFIDRNWEETTPNPGLQEVDTHLPLTGQYRRLHDSSDFSVATDNSAFAASLQGAVQYCAQEPDDPVVPSVPVDHLLSLVSPDALRVLEFDSRFAPLDLILHEYSLACRGRHPVRLW